MKVLASVLLLLQLANYCAAQCADGWADTSGQCMKCSSTISGASNTDFTNAQGFCATNGGNLATVIDIAQQTFAFDCKGTASNNPWFGYQKLPYAAFLDGTAFVAFGSTTIDTATTTGNGCWFINAAADWNEGVCATPLRPFACSRPYDSCQDLEVSGMTSVAYTHSDTSTRVDGSRWVGTTAMYSCATGYTTSGGYNPRTCQSNGTWTGTAPTCVADAVCSAVTTSSYSSVSYSTTASGSAYTTGTIATLTCNSGYDIKSGSTTRMCQAAGTWTGTVLECEKEVDNDALAIGLGVGLGVPLVLALVALTFWMCCRRPSAMPRPGPPPPGPVGYPRRSGRRPYPRRIGPRPAY